VTRQGNGGDLIVNVASLLAEPRGSSRDHAFDGLWVELGPDFALAGPAEARFRLARTNRGLLVDGDVHASIAETCSRCLRPVEVEIAVEFREEVLPSVDLVSGTPLDLRAEPDALRLTEHHEVDLEPIVREAIQLGAPIAPLCRSDCPGLCPTCGEELASGPHRHEDEPIDPRLEALRGFRVDGEAENR
jgi:uncharacterized protein